MDSSPSIREVGSINGGEIFDIVIPARATNAASHASTNVLGQTNQTAKAKAGAIAKPNPNSHSLATVSSNSVPAAWNEPELFVSHLWLMFASQCYLEGRTNREITPLYDIDAAVVHDKDYTQMAEWTFLELGAHLPAYVAYLNTRGRLTRDAQNQRTFIVYGPPFDRGFTNALYKISGTTNVGGLNFPTGFHFQRFEPVESGDDMGKLRVVGGTVVASVTKVIDHCSRTNLLPRLPGNSVVVDYRLMHSKTPIFSVSYSGNEKGRWLTVEEVIRLHKLRNWARFWRMPWWATTLLVVAVFAPVVVVIVKKRKGNAVQ